MVLAVGLSPPFADVAGKKATWKRRSAPNVRYTHQPGWEKSKTKITTSPHFLILHLSLILCRWICKTIRLWAIMWTENDTLLWHVFPLARSFSDVLFDALWCICDVLFDAHQMFIFPSPDGGTWLFLRELLEDRGGGGASMFHKVLKKANRMRIK